MYLIGREMNSRYVEKEKFLNETFKINDHWMQAQLSHKAIVSASALMHGLYPPATSMYKMNKWQQDNARAPLNFYD